MIFDLIQLALRAVTEGQVKIEMVIGAILGSGIMIFYYFSKFKSGKWTSNDARSVGIVILAVIMFSFIVLVLPIK